MYRLHIVIPKTSNLLKVISLMFTIIMVMDEEPTNGTISNDVESEDVLNTESTSLLFLFVGLLEDRKRFWIRH